MILVVGGTGRVGRHVVRLLRGAQRPVRVLTRHPATAHDLQALGAQIVQGDLGDGPSLRSACRGVEAVVASATSLNPRRFRAAHQPETIDVRGHLDLFAIAKAEGVDRCIYVSAIHVDHPQAPPQFRVKRRVEEALRASGLSWTILRPAGFMENLLPVIRAVQRLGVAPLVGQGNSPISYIAAEDVARAALLALERAEVVGTTWSLGGPEDLTNRDCVRMVAAVLGRPVRILSIPVGPVRFVARMAWPLLPGWLAFVEILAFVDRFGLLAPHALPVSDLPWSPMPFQSFVRQRVGQAGEG